MRKTDDTILCEVIKVTSDRVTLDCGHFVDVPKDLPAWLGDVATQLVVGSEQICSECIEQELRDGTDA